MSDSADPVEQFRLGVEAAFGMPWKVERTADGFVARFALQPAVAGEVTASDEVHMRVVVDPDARTFGWTTRRVAGIDIDRERRGWSVGGYEASRERNSRSYSGLRRTYTFRRTPEGLVPDPSGPADSAGREADLRRVAAELGWTEQPGSGGSGVAAGLPPKRTLVLVGVFFAVVLIFIVAVGIFVISTVAGSAVR